MKQVSVRALLVEDNLVSSAISAIRDALLAKKRIQLDGQLIELPKLAVALAPSHLAHSAEPTVYPTPAETLKPARIAVVDALRGIALLGILIVHLQQLYVFGGLPDSVAQEWASGPLNTLFIRVVTTLLTNKFYCLFSFLFGLGFTLMLNRQHDNTAAFYWRFTRRQIILGAIGLLHYLHWQGDILFTYALLGLLLMLFNQLPTKAILLISIILSLDIPGNLFWALYYWGTSAPVTYTPSDYYLLLHGSYYANFLDNLRSFGHLGNVYAIERITRTLGFLLFGLYAGRRHVFQHIEAKQKLLRWGMFGAIGMLLVVKLITTGLEHGANVAYDNIESAKALSRVCDNLHDALLTLLYIAGFTLFFQSSIGQLVAKPLATTGQMALTNYLFQTFAGTLLLCGYGVGLMGHIPVWGAILLSIPLFALQLWISIKWLTYFKYGPVEWLWRSCTYGKLQSLRR